MNYAFPNSRLTRITCNVLLVIMGIGTLLLRTSSLRTTCIILFNLLLLRLFWKAISWFFRLMWPRRYNPYAIGANGIKDKQLIAMFNKETLGHIGNISGEKFRPFLERFENWQNSRNDFLITSETLDNLRYTDLDTSIIQLLEDALSKSRNQLVLRWVQKNRLGSLF